MSANEGELSVSSVLKYAIVARKPCSFRISLRSPHDELYQVVFEAWVLLELRMDEKNVFFAEIISRINYILLAVSLMVR